MELRPYALYIKVVLVPPGTKNLRPLDEPMLVSEKPGEAAIIDRDGPPVIQKDEMPSSEATEEKIEG
jgi:hypothetical protein